MIEMAAMIVTTSFAYDSSWLASRPFGGFFRTVFRMSFFDNTVSTALITISAAVTIQIQKAILTGTGAFGLVGCAPTSPLVG